MNVISAENLVLGRLASNVAKRLLKGEEIIIVNAEKTIITGSRDSILKDYRERRKLVHPRKGPYYPKSPDRILKRSVRGMIPYKKSSGKEAFKRLKVYQGVPKELSGKEIQTIESAQAAGTVKYITLGEVSKLLGSKL
jgi:large subunit ribosomal protein L13